MNKPFWNCTVEELIDQLGSSARGLDSGEAVRRLPTRRHATNAKRGQHAVGLFLAQFKSPLTLLLVFAAVLSFFLHDRTDAVIILIIIAVSGSLGFWQEYKAANILQQLLSLVTIETTVLRDNSEKLVPLADVVPGDVVMLRAGSSVPADCVLIESRDLHVDEAALTGETFPVDKQPGKLPADIGLAQRSNSLFLGTHVVSGTAKALAVAVGRDTEYGQISERLKLRAPETDFERGVRRFGYFLMEVTLMLVVAVFAINVFFQRHIIEAFLFSLALAVGLTPQLLPAIISVNLAHGARRMAERNVVVRRLPSIENFGSMSVLCSDKTGTLTQGVVRVHNAVDGRGQPSDQVWRMAYINSSLESGFANPIDQAIREHGDFDLGNYHKRDECPYDFIRQRLSVVVEHGDDILLITKGAVDHVWSVCSSAEMADGSVVGFAECADEMRARYEEFGNQGFRTLGVAYRRLKDDCRSTEEAEADLTFVGFLLLRDPPKEDVVATIAKLNQLGVSLKMITGDNRRVAASVAKQVGLSAGPIMTGRELNALSDEALVCRVVPTAVFAEVEPNQKERIILACKKAGNVVGFMGDGINDATALHAADVGISVDQAVDVAKEAADIVLMKHDLGVLAEGVREGRRTFANTMKYVFMATSANFGNMFSMAGASLFLPFLPLLPSQVLFMNLLTDLPEMTIAGDRVDDELVSHPQHWDLRLIRRFMLVFGSLSSAFDFLTFALLLLVLRADEDSFRTGWFMESVVSAALVVLIVRTRRPFARSLPSRYLALATAFAIAVAVCLPWLPAADMLGFTALPAWVVLAIAITVAGYIAAAEVAKAIFYRKV